MVQEWKVREARAGQRSLTASTVRAVSCSTGSQLARTGRSVLAPSQTKPRMVRADIMFHQPIYTYLVLLRTLSSSEPFIPDYGLKSL